MRNREATIPAITPASAASKNRAPAVSRLIRCLCDRSATVKGIAAERRERSCAGASRPCGRSPPLAATTHMANEDSMNRSRQSDRWCCGDACRDHGDVLKNSVDIAATRGTISPMPERIDRAAEVVGDAVVTIETAAAAAGSKVRQGLSDAATAIGSSKTADLVEKQARPIRKA